MNDQLPSLAQRLGSAQVAALLNCAAQETRLHLETGKAAEFARLLSQQTIDSLIAADAVPEKNFYLGANGAAVAKILYRDTGGVLRADVVRSFLKGGANLVIDEIGAHVPAIADFARAVTRALNGRVGANAYVSYGAVSVFKPHYDLHDVLAVQIAGAKRWRGYGRPLVNPSAAFAAVKAGIEIGPALWEETMRPGDILYLPRGEIHDAVPEELPSMHLTFGIHPSG